MVCVAPNKVVEALPKNFCSPVQVFDTVKSNAMVREDERSPPPVNGEVVLTAVVEETFWLKVFQSVEVRQPVREVEEFWQVTFPDA